jgi:hypothetical protein
LKIKIFVHISLLFALLLLPMFLTVRGSDLAGGPTFVGYLILLASALLLASTLILFSTLLIL